MPQLSPLTNPLTFPRRSWWVALALMLALGLAQVQAAESGGLTALDRQVDPAALSATVDADGVWVLTDAPGTSWRLRTTMDLRQAGSVFNVTAGQGTVIQGNGREQNVSAIAISFTRDKEGTLSYRWGRDRDTVAHLTAAALDAEPVALELTRLGGTVVLSLNGQVVAQGSARPSHRGATIKPGRDAVLGETALSQLAIDPQYVPVPLVGASNATLTAGESTLAHVPAFAAGALPTGLQGLDGVPFYFAPDGAVVDVAGSMSGVSEPIRVKSVYGRPNWGPEKGRLVTSIAPDTYSALEVVAFSRTWDDAVPRMTVRCGLGDYVGEMADVVTAVPALSAAADASTASSVPVTLADGSTGRIWRLRVPLADTGKLWLATNRVQHLEFSRDIRTHVNLPDPNEFTEMPIGPPSGVVVLAATLVRSPVVVTHSSAEPGNIFNEPQRAAITMSLTNVTDAPVAGRVVANASGPGTGQDALVPTRDWTVAADYTIPAGESRDLTLDLTPPDGLRGSFALELQAWAGETLVQRRETSFAMLAPDTRQALADSPFGTWCFFAAHNLASRENLRDYLGSIMMKGGWRWTYGGAPSTARKAEPDDYRILTEKWKVRHTLQSPPHAYQRVPGWYDEAALAEEFPAWLNDYARPAGIDRVYKVMHESRSSTSILRRFSEFLGGEHYDMPADEKERLQQQFDAVVKYCRDLKKMDPGARIILINDYPGVGIEYMRMGMPKDAFDIFGSEGANFMREPERQPDWLSLHAILQQWKRGAAEYGYEDKELWYTEALYHATNPGNLSEQKQAVTYVREAMLALTNGVTRLAAQGCVKDSADDYRWSNWGEVGFCYRLPEANPKPAFGMFAWLTQILDQATPAGHLETGSTALHVLHFTRPDGSHIYPVWVPRGRQLVTLAVSGTPVVYDAYGNTVATTVTDGAITLTASETPFYVTGAELTGVVARQPQEIARPLGQVILDLADADAYTVTPTPNAVLDASWDYPRFPGTFATQLETVDGAASLRVELQPDDDPRKLLQRYTTIALKQPVQLPGHPAYLTVRVRGNGAWGRIMFECVDAKGRVWTSNGNLYEGSTNSSDNKGDSYISFDGWNTLHFPMVGRYPSSDQFVAYPHNYNWWPTNYPELDDVKATHAAAEAAYPAKKAAWDAADAEYQAALAAYTAAREAGDRKAKKPKSPGREPRPPRFRELGIADIDYPITLTRVFVAMPPHIIYVDREIPVEQPVIHIDSIGVIDAAKETP